MLRAGNVRASVTHAHHIPTGGKGFDLEPFKPQELESALNKVDVGRQGVPSIRFTARTQNDDADLLRHRPAWGTLPPTQRKKDFMDAIFTGRKNRFARPQRRRTFHPQPQKEKYR